MEYANMVVYEKSKEDKELEGMGTTLEVCLIYNNIVYIGHIGDSRIYIQREAYLLNPLHSPLWHILVLLFYY